MTSIEGPTAPSRHLHPVVLLILVAAVFVAVPWLAWHGLTDVGQRRDYGRFIPASGHPGVEIQGIQRCPTAWGAEELVYVRTLARPEAPLLEFDINGQFGNRLRVDLSTDGTWARIHIAHDPPLVGEMGTSHGARYFLPHRQGDTRRQDVYPTSVVAYVDFQRGLVLRYSTATPAERDALLGLRRALPEEETIRGETLHWIPTNQR